MISLNEQPGGPKRERKREVQAGLRCELPCVKRPLDSANHFSVGASGSQFGIMKRPVRWLARDEALNLAAWLVVVAKGQKEFWALVEQISRGSAETEEGHKLRHEQLHRALDELAADWIDQTHSLPSQASVMDLMQWSHKQTIKPTTK